MKVLILGSFVATISDALALILDGKIEEGKEMSIIDHFNLPPIPVETKDTYDLTHKNHFRGGSIGKGGRIKYRRS